MGSGQKQAKNGKTNQRQIKHIFSLCACLRQLRTFEAFLQSVYSAISQMSMYGIIVVGCDMFKANQKCIIIMIVNDVFGLSPTWPHFKREFWKFFKSRPNFIRSQYSRRSTLYYVVGFSYTQCYSSTWRV